jgi:UDP-N-acetylmuramyl pentapeptide synthase
VRGLAEEIVAGAREGGVAEARFFGDANAVAATVGDEVRAGDLILVKGSRSVETDKVVKALKQRFDLAVRDR